MAWVMKMVDNKPAESKSETWLTAGQRLYTQHCTSCHGADRKGTGNNPTLVNIKSKYSSTTFAEVLKTGRRMMPAFQQLKTEEVQALTSYILEQKEVQANTFNTTVTPFDSVNFIPYRLSGYTKFITPEGYPAISPPWGTLNAINLNTGEFEWKVPLGEYEELKARGIPPTGTENYGGPVVTAGGLVFIAATRDNKFRAFHKATGKLLWEYTLPASGFATPAVYELNGKQYVVIACGGGKLGTKPGDAYVAFTLP